mmetsp:Transcript_42561/g.92869  ORF Transcript_42561/g.92869 Transcript_42561/m.92869 type:complete len:206 (+) Transcript_42561:573-1190(+)
MEENGKWMLWSRQTWVARYSADVSCGMTVTPSLSTSTTAFTKQVKPRDRKANTRSTRIGSGCRNSSQWNATGRSGGAFCNFDELGHGKTAPTLGSWTRGRCASETGAASGCVVHARRDSRTLCKQDCASSGLGNLMDKTSRSFSSGSSSRTTTSGPACSWSSVPISTATKDANDNDFSRTFGGRPRQLVATVRRIVMNCSPKRTV